MGFIKDLIGLALIFLAFSNPFGTDIIVRALVFILGFELMSMFAKVGILALSIFFPIFGLLPVFLIGLFVLEFVLSIIIKGFILSLILRPVILTIASLVISQSALPSVLVGIADFLLVFFGMRFKL